MKNQFFLYSIFFFILFITVAAQAQLHIISPNGGEKFKVGSKATIQWDGVLVTDTVTLEYSTNSGTTWNLITNKAVGLRYVWLNIPNTISDFCLLRASRQVAGSSGTLHFLSFVLSLNAEFSPDGNFVIASGVDGNVYIWDSHSTNLLHTFQAESGAGIPSLNALLTWVTYSPDGKSYATMSPAPFSGSTPQDNVLRIFDASTGSKTREWTVPADNGDRSSGMCRYSPDGTQIAATGNDSVTIFSVLTGNLVAKLEGFCHVTASFSGCNPPNFLDWRSDGKQIAAIGAFLNDSVPRYIIGDAATGALIQGYSFPTMPPFFGYGQTIKFNPAGNRIVATAEDSTLRVWDATTPTQIFSVVPFKRRIEWAEYSHSGNSLLVLGSDQLGAAAYNINVYDPNNGQFIRTIGTTGTATKSACYNFDDTRVVVSNASGAILFENPTGGSESDVSDGLWSIIANTGGNVTIRMPVIYARMNDVIDAPIIIDDPGSAVAGGATKIDATLKYNVSMLDPISANAKGSVIGNERVINFSLPIDPNDTILTMLKFKVALGTDSVTLFDLSNTTSDQPAVLASEEDGEFHLLDMCREGGARLLNPNGVTSFIVRKGEGSDNIIDLNLIEKGKTTIWLADYSGRRIQTILEGENLIGSRKITFNNNSLSSGKYFFVLETPTFGKIAPMEVIR